MILLKLIWSKLKLTDKLGLAVIVLLLIYISFQAVQIAYKDHQLIKRVSNDIETVKTALQETTTNINKVINTGKKSTKKAVENNTTIDKSLQNGKTNIDNNDYSVSKIDSLLASYGN